MKIAFTGAHGVGKTTLTDLLSSIINDTFDDPSTPNPGYKINSVTRELLQNGEYQNLQLACIYRRRRKMLASQNRSFVISERFALDEYVYQSYINRHTDTKTGIAAAIIAWEEAMWELDNYWDVVYYIPTDGREVEDDGIRDTNKRYQEAIDELFLGSIDKISRMGIYNIKSLPEKLEDCQEFLQQEVKMWI